MNQGGLVTPLKLQFYLFIKSCIVKLRLPRKLRDLLKITNCLVAEPELVSQSD